MSSSKALTKRTITSADTALMPPPPPPKRIKRPPKVLDEDTYTSALSHIIARDFFPGLLETESTQDYLNALDTGDEEWIDEAERRVREVLSTPQHGRRGVNMTPRASGLETPRAGASNWGGGTPTTAASSTPLLTTNNHPPSQSAPDLSLSLSAFQAKYTSEDNASFNHVLDTQNEKKRSKYAWLWNNNKIPSARQIAQAAHSHKLLTQRSDHDREEGIRGSSSTSLAVVLRPSEDQDARPAGIQQLRPYNPRNTFMFEPEGDVSESHPHLLSTCQAAQEASRAAPRAVNHASTRLPTAVLEADQNTSSTVPESPSLSAIDAAISGHPRHRSISTAAPSVLDDAVTGGETPRVNGYPFVDAEPTPSELGETPQGDDHAKRKVRDRNDLLQHLLGINREDAEGERGPNPFNLQEKSRREDLHHRMVDRQMAAKRPKTTDRVAALRGAKTPKFASSPVVGGRTVGRREEMGEGGLTPAARDLYLKVGRTPVRGGGFERGGSDWTPKTLAGVRAKGV